MKTSLTLSKAAILKMENKGYGKISLIKGLRHCFGLSLKDARYIADDLYAINFWMGDLPLPDPEGIMWLRTEGVDLIITKGAKKDNSVRARLLRLVKAAMAEGQTFLAEDLLVAYNKEAARTDGAYKDMPK